MVQDLTTSFDQFETFAQSEMAKQHAKTNSENAFVPKYWGNFFKCEPYDLLFDTAGGYPTDPFASPRRSGRIANLQKIDYNETPSKKGRNTERKLFPRMMKKKSPSLQQNENSNTSSMKLSELAGNNKAQVIKKLFQKPNKVRVSKRRGKSRSRTTSSRKRRGKKCKIENNVFLPLSVTKASLKQFEDESEHASAMEASNYKQNSTQIETTPETFYAPKKSIKFEQKNLIEALEEKKIVPSFKIINKTTILTENKFGKDFEMCIDNTKAAESLKTNEQLEENLLIKGLDYKELTADFKTLHVSVKTIPNDAVKRFANNDEHNIPKKVQKIEQNTVKEDFDKKRDQSSEDLTIMDVAEEIQKKPIFANVRKEDYEDILMKELEEVKKTHKSADQHFSEIIKSLKETYKTEQNNIEEQSSKNLTNRSASKDKIQRSGQKEITIIDEEIEDSPEHAPKETKNLTIIAEEIEDSTQDSSEKSTIKAFSNEIPFSQKDSRKIISFLDFFKMKHGQTSGQENHAEKFLEIEDRKVKQSSPLTLAVEESSLISDKLSAEEKNQVFDSTNMSASDDKIQKSVKKGITIIAEEIEDSSEPLPKESNTCVMKTTHGKTIEGASSTKQFEEKGKPNSFTRMDISEEVQRPTKKDIRSSKQATTNEQFFNNLDQALEALKLSMEKTSTIDFGQKKDPSEELQCPTEKEVRTNNQGSPCEKSAQKVETCNDEVLIIENRCIGKYQSTVEQTSTTAFEQMKKPFDQPKMELSGEVQRPTEKYSRKNETSRDNDEVIIIENKAIGNYQSGILKSTSKQTATSVFEQQMGQFDLLKIKLSAEVKRPTEKEIRTNDQSSSNEKLPRKVETSFDEDEVVIVENKLIGKYEGQFLKSTLSAAETCHDYDDVFIVEEKKKVRHREKYRAQSFTSNEKIFGSTDTVEKELPEFCEKNQENSSYTTAITKTNEQFSGDAKKTNDEVIILEEKDVKPREKYKDQSFNSTAIINSNEKLFDIVDVVEKKFTNLQQKSHVRSSNSIDSNQKSSVNDDNEVLFIESKRREETKIHPVQSNTYPTAMEIEEIPNDLRAPETAENDSAIIQDLKSLIDKKCPSDDLRQLVPEVTLVEILNDIDNPADSVDNEVEIYAEGNESEVEILDDEGDDYQNVNEFNKSSDDAEIPLPQDYNRNHQPDYNEFPNCNFFPSQTQTYVYPGFNYAVDLRSIYFAQRYGEFQIPQINLDYNNYRVQINNPYDNSETRQMKITEYNDSEEEQEEKEQQDPDMSQFKSNFQENFSGNLDQNQLPTLSQPPPISFTSEQRLPQFQNFTPSQKTHTNFKSQSEIGKAYERNDNNLQVNSQNNCKPEKNNNNNQWKIVSSQNIGHVRSQPRDVQMYENTGSNEVLTNKNNVNTVRESQIVQRLHEATPASQNYRHQQGQQSISEIAQFVKNNCHINDVKFGKIKVLNGRLYRTGSLCITFGDHYKVQVIGDLILNNINDNNAFDAFFGPRQPI